MMTHRFVTAYWEGHRAYPKTIANPYAGIGDRTVARMWRLGWQRAAEDNQVIPSEEERIARLAAEIDELLD
ncbi:hypothetical protein H7I58_25145 [Mycolicibacterium moriokaense]|nr:hypothetical protein [Mycolicibacterium moriokaense]